MVSSSSERMATHDCGIAESVLPCRLPLLPGACPGSCFLPFPCGRSKAFYTGTFHIAASACF